MPCCLRATWGTGCDGSDPHRGGEVFTRPGLFELIDGVIANRIRYNLLTKGTLITEEFLSQFEHSKRRLGLNSTQVSIDGSCVEVHNLSRPKG